MQTLFLITLILILIPIIVEDFQHRKISLAWPLGLIAISLVIQAVSPLTVREIAGNILINFAIVILNYGLLTLYFSFRNGRLINISNEYLGTGDIVFLISVSFLFSPLNFVIFLLVSLIFTLSAWIPFIKSTKTIPLAGLQALFLSLQLLALFFISQQWKVNNDQFTLTLLLNIIGNG